METGDLIENIAAMLAAMTVRETANLDTIERLKQELQNIMKERDSFKQALQRIAGPWADRTLSNVFAEADEPASIAIAVETLKENK